MWLVFSAVMMCLVSCSDTPVDYIRTIDVENNRMIMLAGEKVKGVNFYEADFVVLGGGLGGIAAALSICSSGRTVVLVEETDRIAGCFSYQDTSRYSENRFVETSGTTLSYQTFRTRIKEWYAAKSMKQPEFFSGRFDGMNDFANTSFCFETDAALDVIGDMLAENVKREKLTIIRRHKVAKVITYSGRIASLLTIDLDKHVCDQVTGWMYVDATRHGDILPLAGIEYVSGVESSSVTGEPHAPAMADSLFDATFLYAPFVPPMSSDKPLKETVVADLKIGTPPATTGYATFIAGPLSRRIAAFETLTEKDISAESNDGPRAKFVSDSIGIGYYPISVSADISGGDEMDIPVKPFQIPLGALISKTLTNYISGGITLGVSYLVSTACRAPSTEWTIGEAAGEIAAYCAGYKVNTHELFESPEHVRGLQDWLVTKRVVPIYWYDDVKPGDKDFAEAQMKPFDEPGHNETSTTLHYRSAGK